MIQKKWFFLISVIAIICFIGVITYGIFYAPHQITQGPQKEGRPIIPTYILFIAIVILIIAVLPLFYYYIHKSLQKNLSQNMDNISNINKENKTNESGTEEQADSKEVIMKFLSYNEKKIVNKLVEQKGSTLQSEISRMDSMGKVKSHRALKDLERKGIVTIEKYGNTNRINFTEEFKKIFIK